jgi:hypothetical protein
VHVPAALLRLVLCCKVQGPNIGFAQRETPPTLQEHAVAVFFSSLYLAFDAAFLPSPAFQPRLPWDYFSKWAWLVLRAWLAFRACSMRHKRAQIRVLTSLA